jgi:hypothetical protein
MAFENPVYPSQSAFSRGEVSPRMFGRVDLATWAQALRTLRNFTVNTEGSVSNRPGFGYLGNALSNVSKASILVPFIFSTTQSYVIEIGSNTAQVFSLGAQVNSATTVNVIGATLVFFPSPDGWRVRIACGAAHGLSAGQNINISGVNGTGSLSFNGQRRVQEIVSPTIFTILAPQGNTGVYTSGGVVAAAISFATPWAAADLPKVRWAQSTDTLTLVHPNYPPYEIKRTSASSFTCVPAVYINGPFLPQNTDGVTFVWATGKSGVVTLNSTAPIFNANHVGALFQMTQQDLSQIQPWEPTKQFAASSIVGTYRRSNGKNYLAVSLVATPAAQNATGTFAPSHSQGTAADGDGNTIVGVGNAGVNWQYQDSGFGVVLITGFVSANQVTGVVQPNYTGGPGLLPVAVVGGPQTVVGPFTFTGDGVTKTFGPLTANTSTDPSKFYVLVNGSYVSPSAYSISATGGGNIVFLAAPAAGAGNIVVRQISSLGQTTFWAFGAFSADQGYPSTVSYFPDRLILASTPQQPVGVFGSKTSLYHDFGVSSPIIASDSFSAFLNAKQLNAINDLIPLSDLLIGTSNITWRLWPGSTGVALSPLALASNPQSYYGQNPLCASVLFGDSAVYPEYDGRRLRDAIYQFAYDKFLGQELTLYSRHLIPKGTQFSRLAYKPDPLGQFIIGLRSDGPLLVCTYLREQQVIGWARWDTQGTFEDQIVVPEGTSYALYALTNRLIGGVQQRFIERLTSREATTVYDYNFLDCSLSYDGRNTTAVTMTLTNVINVQAGGTGQINASSAAGWATFLQTDALLNNELWVYLPLTFTQNVANQVSGVLASPTTPGTYVMTFSNGQSRPVTVAADGVTCTWQIDLGGGTITSATCRTRCLITAVNSSTIAQVRFKDPLPAGLNGLATSTWTFARTTFYGASQIAGQAAVGYIDGNVYGISANAYYPNGNLTIGNDGSFTLPYAGGVVTVGLPYLCDFETLPLNLQGQAEIRNRAKTNPAIYLDVSDTRNFIAGTSFETAQQFPVSMREFEPYVANTDADSGVLWTRVTSDLSSECHSCIRQNMPLPITIRQHIPAVGVAGYIG